MSGKRGSGVGIVGMGAALPEQVRTNDWWPEEFHREHARRAQEDLVTKADQADESQVDPEAVRHAAQYREDVFRGAQRRRVIADGDLPSDLETLAARRAMEAAGVGHQDVDLLLVYSVLPDYAGPLNHPVVADKLGLRADTTCLSVYAGCASFVSHLFVASRLIQAGDSRAAVIVQSSVMSRVIDYRAPSSVNVGDGAIAAVIQRVDEDLGFIAHHQITRGNLHPGMLLVPTKDPGAPWFRGDLHGSALTAQPVDQHAAFEMGVRVASFCREACTHVLDNAGYAASDVDFFCITQPTVWFGRACCDAVGIPRDRTLDTYTEYAHLMGASAPLNLFTAYERGRLDRGDLVLIYSPGAGFIQSAALYRWNLPRRPRGEPPTPAAQTEP